MYPHAFWDFLLVIVFFKSLVDIQFPVFIKINVLVKNYKILKYVLVKDL